MVEVQLKDGSFKSINQDFILYLESNKKVENIDKKTGNVYTVNDFKTGTEYTVTMLNGDTLTITKLGLDVLRKVSPRLDFDINYLRNDLYGY